QAFALRAGPGFATLLRMDTTDHLRAVVSKRLLGMERPGLAGQALNKDLGILVNENRHYEVLKLGVDRRDDLLGSIVQIVSRCDRKTRFVEDLLAELDICTFESHDQRNLQTDLLNCCDNA